MKFLILNGPNLNLLGLREPELYGKRDYAALLSYLHEVCASEGIAETVRQSNHEGELVDIIQDAYGKYDAIVINPAAYTHTSIAIADALKAVALPAVEVHLTDISKREAYRQISYTSEACLKTYMGLGFEGYAEAIRFLKKHLTGGTL